MPGLVLTLSVPRTCHRACCANLTWPTTSAMRPETERSYRSARVGEWQSS